MDSLVARQHGSALDLPRPRPRQPGVTAPTLRFCDGHAPLSTVGNHHSRDSGSHGGHIHAGARRGGLQRRRPRLHRCRSGKAARGGAHDRRRATPHRPAFQRQCLLSPARTPRPGSRARVARRARRPVQKIPRRTARRAARGLHQLRGRQRDARRAAPGPSERCELPFRPRAPGVRQTAQGSGRDVARNRHKPRRGTPRRRGGHGRDRRAGVRSGGASGRLRSGCTRRPPRHAPPRTPAHADAGPACHRGRRHHGRRGHRRRALPRGGGGAAGDRVRRVPGIVRRRGAPRRPRRRRGRTTPR